ncbi:MAG: hypothetical protein CYPHOPRED_004672 [Cyphobasidiales sp. Tagirdzhanova-0007]|nr:MAG: hypothetical protein CYPHOPRED_004672 [Cyphobasidiales sp. Tagirdzhanova-0007]
MPANILTCLYLILSLIAVAAALPTLKSSSALDARDSSTYNLNVYNECSQPIWPAAFLNQTNTTVPIEPAWTGSAASIAQGESWQTTVPLLLTGARIWARTGCQSDGTQTPDATLVEFGWSPDASIFIDISRVASIQNTNLYQYNLPVGLTGTNDVKTCSDKNCGPPNAFVVPTDFSAITNFNPAVSEDVHITFCPS